MTLQCLTLQSEAQRPNSSRDDGDPMYRLTQFLLDLFVPGNVIKYYVRPLIRVHTYSVADIQKSLAYGSHASGHPPPQQKQNTERQYPVEQKVTQSIVIITDTVFNPLAG